MVQGKKEGACVSSETFIRALYELAEHFSQTKMIVIGLKDKDVSEKLQLRSTLTLEQTIQYARQTELTF